MTEEKYPIKWVVGLGGRSCFDYYHYVIRSMSIVCIWGVLTICWTLWYTKSGRIEQLQLSEFQIFSIPKRSQQPQSFKALLQYLCEKRWLEVEIMFVPASWRSAAGVRAGGLNGHWGSRAPVEDIYTCAPSCTFGGRRLTECTAPPLDARGACCGAWRQHLLLLLWRKQLLLGNWL